MLERFDLASPQAEAPPVPPPPVPTPVVVTVPVPVPVLPKQPIVVDTVTSGWEVLSSVGTAGALLIAAWAFAQNIGDKRRGQAAAVTLTFDPPLNDLGENYVRTMTIHNESDLVVPSFRFYIVDPNRNPTPSANKWYFGARSSVNPHDDETSQLHGDNLAHVAIWFLDANGRQWVRHSNGMLRRYRRRFRWLREKFVFTPMEKCIPQLPEH